MSVSGEPGFGEKVREGRCKLERNTQNRAWKEKQLGLDQEPLS